MTPERPGTAADLPDVIVPARDYAEMLRDLAALRAERDRLAAALEQALDEVPTHRQRVEIGDDGKPTKVGRRIARRPEFVRADCIEAVRAVLSVLTPASGSEGGEAG